ncbi:Protocatechuate 3,4-dioxygenase beta subunit [Rubellimicrobium thermophilum DSM 16684]|uniref:Protocatechuate 3,4-dioxygenase beta subunit n=1 Tax=Rubellimicrobium thermophilum DSM 16684 TaxID=1123069 RepID=S9SJM6_9RHOB|nr:intradiol ring-cleavage dioxygenase [Rubellimicrobium thermophilum]EPX86539.1 Protocatechuate 3,4-dioxygenase beta subunit [Rubellimicrobium thermophilum DSM 16684]
MSASQPTRRALLATLAVSPAALLGAHPAPAQEAAATAAGLISPNVCLLAVEVTEGPYYIDPGLLRTDITEGLPGVPLELLIQVVDAACRPIAGARVDVWHCDAQGNYSGFAAQGSDATRDTTGQTFLRGTQMTDDRGIATFRTIYPGWYRGRTTHIHHKIFLDEVNVLTGQIFFPDALSQYLYDHVPAYAREGVRDTVNAGDRIAAQAGEGAYAALREAGDRYVASLVVGIDPAARSADSGPGGPGGAGEPPPGGGMPPAGPAASQGAAEATALVPGGG